MSHATTPDAGRGLADPPSAVEITILADPAARSMGARLAAVHGRGMKRSRALAGALTVLAATAVIVAGVVVVGGGATRHVARAGTDAPGAAGVDAAYGFAPRCLAVTILRNHQGYARADFNRASPCGRWGGTTTAIFHRAGGVWRPTLVAVTYACPVRSLPRAVQVQLGVCQ